MTWSTLPRSSCPSERLLWKNFSSPPRPFQNSDGLLLLCMSSLSVLDINPFSDVWFSRLPSPSGGCLLLCGWFPLLGAFPRRQPPVDFCPVPSVDALEESQWTSQPPSPKAGPSAVHLSLLTPLMRLHACPLPSKQPGGGGTLPTVGFLLFLWLPHWLHVDVPLLSEPLPPPRAAFR